MNDHLENELERLAEMPTRSAPTTADLHAWDRRRSLRRARFGTMVVAAAFLLGIGAVALSTRGTEPAGVASTGKPAANESTTTSAPAPPPDEVTTLDPAHGYRISGPNGEIAGYVDQEAMDDAMSSGLPTLPIGTGAVPVHGFEVRSSDGELVGYYLESIGFLSLEQTAEPQHVDELVRSEPAMSQAEAKELLESIKTEVDAQGD